VLLAYVSVANRSQNSIPWKSLSNANKNRTGVTKIRDSNSRFEPW
jgi:hypothetical protein